ncbi:MAG: hypothetical protein ACQESP_10930 [Candidatus Muiribacteriota bacterium]
MNLLIDITGLKLIGFYNSLFLMESSFLMSDNIQLTIINGLFLFIFIAVIFLINKTQYIFFSLFYIISALMIYYSFFIKYILIENQTYIYTLHSTALIFSIINLFLAALDFEKGGKKIKIKKRKGKLRLIDKIKRKKEKTFVLSPDILLINPEIVNDSSDNINFYVHFKVSEDINKFVTPENKPKLSKAQVFLKTCRLPNFKITLGDDSKVPDGVPENSAEANVISVYYKLKNEYYNPVVLSNNDSIIYCAEKYKLKFQKLEDFLL